MHACAGKNIQESDILQPKTFTFHALYTNLLMPISGTILGILSVPTAAHTLGFSSVGIKAGSFAATWMSNVAIANAGAIAACSPIAGWQSIGAVGLASCTMPATAIITAGGCAGAFCGFAVGCYTRMKKRA